MAASGVDDPDDAHRPLLSLVIASRNDDHAGGAAWRLQTALNHLASSAQRSVGLDRIEAIVCDWGSDEPLRDVLALDEAARRMTSFLEVPPRLAEELQGDSVFAEVLANNAAIRRSRGRFIGRIDQDTLVGSGFLNRFAEWVDAGVDGLAETSFLFVGRRSVPESFCRRRPQLQAVQSYLRRFGKLLPREGLGQQPWFDAPVGVVILHRDLWARHAGYDERMVFWGFMETDLALRVAADGALVPLGAQIGCDIFHLGHGGRSLRSTPRRKNPRRHPGSSSPSGPNWGLSGYDLELRSSTASEAGAGGAMGEQTVDISAVRLLPGFLAEWAWQLQCGVLRTARSVFRGDRIVGEGSS